MKDLYVTSADVYDEVDGSYVIFESLMKRHCVPTVTFLEGEQRVASVFWINYVVYTSCTATSAERGDVI